MYNNSYIYNNNIYIYFFKSKRKSVENKIQAYLINLFIFPNKIKI